MKKIILTTVLFSLVILSAGQSMAQSQFAGGSGTAEDPYKIATLQHFLAIPNNTTENYIQTADIEIPNNTFHDDSIKCFNGTYDGQGYMITAEGTQSNSLFGTITHGTVKNILIYGVNVVTSNNTGVVCNSLVGNIDNVKLLECNITITSAAVHHGGLLTASMFGGKISFCSAIDCKISLTGSSCHIGGLIGFSSNEYSAKNIIEYCSFGGKIEVLDTEAGTNEKYIGGIVGLLANQDTIRACAIDNSAINLQSGSIENTKMTGITYVIKNGNANGAVYNSYVGEVATNLSGHYQQPDETSIFLITNADISHVLHLDHVSGPSGPSATIEQYINFLNDGLKKPGFNFSDGNIVHVNNGIESITANKILISKNSGDFSDISTWNFKGTGETRFTISAGHTITVQENKNVPSGANVVIADGGNLIDKRSNTTLTATMQKNITAGGWNFIGLAMNEDIRAFVNQPAIVALAFDYGTGNWGSDYLHYYTDTHSGDHVGKGNGILVYTNEGFTLESTGTLINDNVTVTADVTANSGDGTTGNWMALANPYPAAMLASNIISGIQTDNSNQAVQGQVVYVRGSNAWRTISSSTEKVDGGHGFFVNFATTGSKTVNMQKSWTQTTTAKSTLAERDFLTVSVSTDGYKVPVMFAKNEAATAEYDIFDANKMFGDGTVAEPYLICNGIDLCKEEVNTLPYTATMNIKSGEARSIDIIAENIPEGYSLTLIDNEEEIAMNQGDTYTVEIASGENADRFKLKIGEKNVSITDVEALEELSIRNNNRNIIIEGGKNIKAEVYNTLGQKVYETTARNFNIEGVAAGAYVIKVQSGNAVQSHKMIIR